MLHEVDITISTKVISKSHKVGKSTSSQMHVHTNARTYVEDIFVLSDTKCIFIALKLNLKMIFESKLDAPPQ